MILCRAGLLPSTVVSQVAGLQLMTMALCPRDRKVLTHDTLHQSNSTLLPILRLEVRVGGHQILVDNSRITWCTNVSDQNDDNSPKPYPNHNKTAYFRIFSSHKLWFAVISPDLTRIWFQHSVGHLCKGKEQRTGIAFFCWYSNVWKMINWSDVGINAILDKVAKHTTTFMGIIRNLFWRGEIVKHSHRRTNRTLLTI